MKNFNIKRFGQVLRYELTTNYRSMLWNALGVMLFYLIICWFVHKNWRDDYAIHQLTFAEFVSQGLADAGLVVSTIVVLAAACLWFKNVQKKAPRTVMLMMPASNLEKFLARWVCLVVFTVVVCFFSFFAADLLQALYLGVKGEPMTFATDNYLKEFADDYGRLYTLETYAGILFCHSFSLMCGVLYKRYHVVAALASWFLLFAVVGYVLHLLFPEPQGVYSEQYDTYRTYAVIAGSVFFTVLWTVLAYRIFCRWQVVTHKFVNL